MRSELVKLLPLYRLIKDCISGEHTIKEAKTLYLPMPDASDTSASNIERYKAYVKRAVFYNVTRRTLTGLIGQVFSKDPVVKVKPAMKNIVEDCTGTGINLTQLSKRGLAYNLAFSRGGLFIDYPETDETGTSVEEMEKGNIRPTLNLYSPTSIINWRVKERGAKEVLSLVVLYECYCASDDGFEMKNSPQFRVLRLDENDNYVQEIWRELIPTEFKENRVPKGNFAPKTMIQRDSNGEPLKEILFSFFGSENNDSNPDNPNMYDLASINLAHFRNSADYEEACYIVGQPTPVATGLTEEWLKDVLKGQLSFGSRGGIPLPVGATATLLQATGNTMIHEAMETKERQMVALGAKLVEQKQVQRTAFETKVESTSEGSILSSSTKNVSSVFEWGLKKCAMLMGLDESGIEFALNSEFDMSKMSPDEQAKIIEAWSKGAITWSEMRTGLKKAGTATEDDAKAKAEIEADMVKAMALAMPENEPGTDNDNESEV